MQLVEFRSAKQALFAGLRIASTLAIMGVTVGEWDGDDAHRLTQHASGYPAF
jgi:NitT/TauT family transport system permease protein